MPRQEPIKKYINTILKQKLKVQRLQIQTFYKHDYSDKTILNPLQQEM